MKITISGLPGSGTSTVGETLAKRNDMEYFSTGYLFRELAKEQGYSLEEFTEIAQNDLSIDKELDDKQIKLLKEYDDVVFEGRLVGWFAQSFLRWNNASSVYLKCDLATRVERICKRDSIGYSTARMITLDREKAENERFYSIYGFNTNALNIYDMVIDTEKVDTDVVVSMIESYVNGLTTCR